ncbi:hypothetical protein [Nannocystis punicea]|uniref:Transposase, YhgA-like n=1 Tax=Nannocystis punicea TaxID=2995304 RepID=A0ABY7HAH2_9BACT|nr:hypothetical protein [Nannocystis poenicansa]WAS96110.1 hypothetical protein O0S08_08090 [Nannocystis poenicansa]
MPSLPHTVLLELLRRAPPLVVTLLREGCAAPLPRFAGAQVVECEFADIDPAEVRADLVLTLTGKGGRPALAIVVEAQLRRDPAKRWVWPVYLASLRRRLQCPVRLLVLTTRPAVARWCSRPIDMGDGRWVLVPDVLGPEQIPQITRAGAARREPELAVLSVLAHGRGPRAVAIGRAALAGVTMLDSARRPLYTDLVRFFLGAAARAELGVDAMQPLSDEEMLRPYLYLYRRSIFGQLMAPLHRARREARQAEARATVRGHRDGELAGLHEALLAILDARSIALTATQRRTITSCRRRAQLLRWVQRAATVTSTRELFAARRATKQPVAPR